MTIQLINEGLNKGTAVGVQAATAASTGVVNPHSSRHSSNRLPLAWTLPFSGGSKKKKQQSQTKKKNNNISVLNGKENYPNPNNNCQHLILVGGGHAHVQVIKALNKQSRPKHLDVTVIDIQESASYSGMVPGCLSNIYTPEDTLLHLRPLTNWAGINFIQNRVVDIDFNQNIVYLQQQQENNNDGSTLTPTPTSLSFDAISIDIGSTSRGLLQTKGARQYTLPTRPISDLVTRFERACEELLQDDDLVDATRSSSLSSTTSFQPHPSPPNVVVIGGGAAGIELSMSVMGRFKSIINNYKGNSNSNDNNNKIPNVRVTLLDSNDKLLPQETDVNRNALLQIMKERNIDIKHNCIVDEVQENSVVLKSGECIPFTHCLWATGAGAHDLSYWLGTQRGLSISDHGWIQVNSYMQSISHPQVFAAGDCCTIVKRDDESGKLPPPPPKAGVYAVRAGPILIQNLIAYLDGQYKKMKKGNDEVEEAVAPASSSSSSSLVEYHPQDDFLKLIVCGDGTALGFRFGFPIHGKWVMQLKDAIDQKFMNLFKEENLPPLEEDEDEDDDDSSASSTSNSVEQTTKKQRYDTSQYDATYGDRPSPMEPQNAAKYIKRTDDNVDYMVAWNILRDMADDETYRNQVLQYIHHAHVPLEESMQPIAS